MSINALQDSPPIILSNLSVHPAVVRLNSSGHALQAVREQCTPHELSEISPVEIRAELERMLESPELKEKPMLCGFLGFVVEETLAGRVHEIKGYTVATQVFGRRGDFNPTIDPIVRIQAGRLRRTLESYYSGRGSQDPVRIEIGKGSYVPIFSRFDPEKVEPEQIHRVAGMPADDTNTFREPLDIFPSFGRNGPSIAVMPLSNLTNDPDQDYLGDGLTEELMNELACCWGLRVNASRSTMEWKTRPSETKQIGRELGVRFFLGGSFRKVGRTVKFTIRLVDTETRLQVWGEQYRRDVGSDNLIDLQEEIARSVAGRIGGLFGIIPQKLSKEARTRPSLSLGAYDAFLRFGQYQSELSPKAHTLALEALEQVYIREPKSGVVLAMLACLYANECAIFHPDAPALMEKAVALAGKGVFLEPQNQLVRALLAYVFFVSGRKVHFLREAEQALQLNPYAPDIIALLGWGMALYGECARGLPLLENGMQSNPSHPGWFHLVSYLNHYRQGQFSEAYYEATSFNTPQLFWDPLLRAAALSQLGKKREAGIAVDELLTIKPDFLDCCRKLIGSFVKDPQMVVILLEGLRKAGLEV